MTKSNHITISIEGPSKSGKTTLARYIQSVLGQYLSVTNEDAEPLKPVLPDDERFIEIKRAIEREKAMEKLIRLIDTKISIKIA